MQRFYCKVCKKIKRVQHLPVGVVNPTAPLPQDRVGECRRHNQSYTRAEYRAMNRKVAR